MPRSTRKQGRKGPAPKTPAKPTPADIPDDGGESQLSGHSREADELPKVPGMPDDTGRPEDDEDET